MRNNNTAESYIKFIKPSIILQIYYELKFSKVFLKILSFYFLENILNFFLLENIEIRVNLIIINLSKIILI